MVDPTSSALPAGTVFNGRYEIGRCLKAGGMGAVYEAVHLQTRKRRALKVMLPQIVGSPELRSRFELEARVTADIESEHIVETFDAGVDDATGAPFLVMELLRGEDLESVIARRGPRSAEETVTLLAQAALALDKTHAAGVVHRDLKPENLFLTTRDDGSPRLKILDFGIAKVVAQSAQTMKQTATIGTPLYMSPEQISGDGSIGPRSDVYALGHIAYALLVGEAYWETEERDAPSVYALWSKILAGPKDAATARAARREITLPAAFDAWFARAVASAPGDRFESASALVAALADALGVAAPRLSAASAPAARGAAGEVSRPDPAQASGGAPQGTTPGVTHDPAVTRGTRSRAPILAALAALGVAGAGVAFMSRGAATPSSAPAVSIAPNVLSATSAAAAPAPTPVVVPAETAPSVATSAVEPAPFAKPTATAAAQSNKPSSTAAAAQKPAAAPKAPSPSRAPAGCDPPYEVDAQGIRRMKPQCL
jgi:serine/threonine-protein kinase